ncbi:hypothetical protein [Caenimonas aquaedulcis]|nr:hypothetical protein [Caenimonas aquaedulcis]
MWTPTLAWLAAVTGAVALAVLAPSESSLLGRMPTVSAKRLDQQKMVLPQGLPAERTLALVTFTRGHRVEIDSWIQGLRLDRDSSIPWFRMPVLNDPGTDNARGDIENKLLARHPAESDRSRLVPVFTDRDAFIRAAGLSGTEHAWVLVLNREGKVLARAEGGFDEDKAQALRQTLLAQNSD